MSQASLQRASVRINHITIRLHYLHDGQWHMVRAQRWNATGFCFFYDQPLPLGLLPFKRSLQHFDGELVWTSVQQDPLQVLEMLVNEQIHQYVQSLHDQPVLQGRLLQLARVHGMVDDKRRVLASLGVKVTEQQWHQQLANRMAQPLYQSGVHVRSAVWKEIVHEANKVAGVVQDLGNWPGFGDSAQ
ncbi:hypothetical protein KIK84_09050 [Curvibacter sp. CHRR-16]|uniref:hypothetical protein n=1 Tax=Curvibacter sp. CHRR-16 TaxID=2835872 RepID=UPI001BD95379|nr:hypothetical protein [Curvibacter sp. CHRR-16]MBT0570475.1 hypothetical protein [Curvibacter sp. CHRR-16]